MRATIKRVKNIKNATHKVDYKTCKYFNSLILDDILNG